MSIIKNYQDGKTELNKLKFKATMGAGHPGNPPLIQKRIPTESKEASSIAGTQLGRRLDDVGRMGQILARAEGLKFLGNNTLLNQTVSQSYLSGQRSLKDRLQDIGSNLAFTAQDTIRTLGSTLASIPVAGTGIHFVKGALAVRTYLNKGFVKSDFIKSPLQQKADSLITNSGNSASLVDAHGADKNIKSYFYGARNLVENGLKALDYIQNPEKFLEEKGSKKSKATVNIGDPGASKVKYDKDGLYYDRKSDNTAVDLINAKGEFTGINEVQEDYVKFLFEILPIDSNTSTFLQFRSFIDNFDDAYTGNWSQVNYIGRGESMYNYSGFTRGINVSFKSAVATRTELLPMYEKLNSLASTTAPTYSGNKLMRGTVVRMTIGDYIANTPGVITSVNYSWRTGYPWEIKQNADKSKPQILPHILDCSLSFTPIHSFTPTTLSKKYIAYRPKGGVEVGEGDFGESF